MGALFGSELVRLGCAINKDCNSLNSKRYARSSGFVSEIVRSGSGAMRCDAIVAIDGMTAIELEKIEQDDRGKSDLDGANGPIVSIVLERTLEG